MTITFVFSTPIFENQLSAQKLGVSTFVSQKANIYYLIFLGTVKKNSLVDKAKFKNYPVIEEPNRNGDKKIYLKEHYPTKEKADAYVRYLKRNGFNEAKREERVSQAGPKIEKRGTLPTPRPLEFDDKNTWKIIGEKGWDDTEEKIERHNKALFSENNSRVAEPSSFFDTTPTSPRSTNSNRTSRPDDYSTRSAEKFNARGYTAYTNPGSIPSEYDYQIPTSYGNITAKGIPDTYNTRVARETPTAFNDNSTSVGGSVTFPPPSGEIVHQIQVAALSNTPDLQQFSNLNSFGTLLYKYENGLYKVRIGNYSSKTSAQNDLAVIKKSYPGSFIVNVFDDNAVLLDQTTPKTVDPIQFSSSETTTTRFSGQLYVVRLGTFPKSANLKTTLLENYGKVWEVGFGNSTVKYLNLPGNTTASQAMQTLYNIKSLGYYEAYLMTRGLNGQIETLD